MKKIIALLLAAVLCIGLFAACSKGGDGGKTVVYWTLWESTEPQGQAIAESCKKFTEKTGIKVDVQFKGRTGIREGLQPALDANQTIDIFDEDIDRINNTFAPYLMNLEDLAAKYKFEEHAIPSLIKTCREVGKGKLMSVPYQPNVFCFFYSEKIFKEAGVTAAPTTWDEMLDACAKIKAAGYIPITCDDAYICSMIGYHLGRLVGEEGVRDIAMNGKWDSPAVKQFAKDYEELASKGYFSPTIEANVWPSGQNQELAGGKAAMYLNGSWLPNEVKGLTGMDFKWGAFPYPALEGGKVGVEASNIGCEVYAINKNSKVADEAFQLIDFLTKGDADAELTKQSVGIPADVSAKEWPELMAGVKPVMEKTTVRWSWTAGMECNNDITPAIKENVLKLCGGTINADQFVANMMKAAGK